MAQTVADQVFSRVSELLDEGRARTRADAFRVVSGEVGRSVSAVSSAFYAGARRADDPSVAEPSPQRAGRRGPHSDSPTLYAEMLPLVEAGASIEQAARRFGHDEGIDEIAAGFRRWMARQGSAIPEGTADTPALRDAEARITALEAENRELRRRLTEATRAISRAAAMLELSP